MPKPFSCPKCGSPMQAVVVDEFAIDRCDGCGGLWFDLREHERMADSSAVDAAAVDTGDASRGAEQNARRDIDCPVCHVRMLKLSVPDQLHIKYESCPVCFGAFFDAGEFRDYAKRSVGEQARGFFRGFRRKPKSP
jgi:Zn-finger nucleic acid-binding protein